MPQVKMTLRYEAYLSDLIGAAAQRAGMTKNDWIISVVRQQVDLELREQRQQAHLMQMQQDIRHIRARVDWTMELLLTFVRMLFSMMGTVDAQKQKELNQVGAARSKMFFEDVSERIARGKRTFTEDMEQLVFHKQDWEQTLSKTPAKQGQEPNP